MGLLQKGNRVEKFLIDAQSMVEDDVVPIENARKFVNQHPVL